jgi:hypothetical protein
LSFLHITLAATCSKENGHPKAAAEEARTDHESQFHKIVRQHML